QAPAPTIAPRGTAARRAHGDAVARGAPDAAAPPGPAGGARLRPRARTARAGPAVRAVLPAGHPVHRRRCGGLDLAGPAVPGRGLLAHSVPAAVPAGLLGAADLHLPPAPASADDMDLPAGLLLRAHPHHRGGALGPDQPRRRRPRAGPARGDAPGRLGARRGADPRLRLVDDPLDAAAPLLFGGAGLAPVPDGAPARLHLPAGGGRHHHQAPSRALLADAPGLRAARRLPRGLARGRHLRPRRRLLLL